MRLIDADALNKTIEDEFKEVGVYDESGSTVIYDFQNIIDSMPTINHTPTKSQFRGMAMRYSRKRGMPWSV